MTDTIATAITERGATSQRRSCERRYTITGLERLDRHGDLIAPALEVSAHHDKDRKRYLLTIRRLVIGPMFMRTVIDYRRSEPEWMKPLSYSVPATRYSQRDMQSLHAAHLVEIEPHLPALLDWAAGALTEED